MKLNLNDIAVFEARNVSDAMVTGSGNTIRRRRGWWLKSTGRYLGANRTEAEDTYACEHMNPMDAIVWTR